MSFHLNLNVDRVVASYPDAALAVAPSSTVGEVIQLMRAQKGAAVLVVGELPEHGREDQPSTSGARGVGAGNSNPHESVCGIFTERDALKWLAAEKPLTLSIASAMTPRPCMVQAETTVGATIELMAEGGYRHLPIVRADGAPLGVASVRGIVNYLVDHFPQTIYTLPPEPGRSPTQREGA